MNNKDEANKIRREKYAENPTPHIEHATEYYYNNKESVLNKQKEYRKLNAEKRKELNKQYYEANKEASANSTAEKRKIIKEQNDLLTKEEIYSKTPIKYCPKCNISHNSEDFFIDKTKKDGLSRICKAAKKLEKLK